MLSTLNCWSLLVSNIEYDVMQKRAVRMTTDEMTLSQ